MKKLVLLAVLMLSTAVAFSQSTNNGSESSTKTKVEYKIDGNTVSSVATVKTTEPLKQWEKNGQKMYYQTKDAGKLPIYISSKGAKFVIMTSKKTGKEYRKYLTDLN